jgi:hypothetical protein
MAHPQGDDRITGSAIANGSKVYRSPPVLNSVPTPAKLAA